VALSLTPGQAADINQAVPLPDQVQNPVWLLPQDHNGVIISLPPIDPGGAASVAGTLVFGIGTAANNGLGSAQVYTTDALGHFTTTYAGHAYPTSYLDTGSNVLFLLDAATLGIPECAAHTVAAGFYCPSSPVSFTVTTTGANGVSGPPAAVFVGASGPVVINNTANPVGGTAASPWTTNNCGPNDEPFSFHGLGCHAIFMDGHVSFIRNDISPLSLRYLLTSSEGVGRMADATGY